MYTKTKLRSMQDIVKFESIFERLDGIYESELKERTEKSNKRGIVAMIILLLSLVPMTKALLAYQSGESPLIWGGLMVACIAAGLMLAVFDVGGQGVAKEYQEKIVGGLIKEIEPNFNYTHEVMDKAQRLKEYKDFGYHVYSNYMVIMDNEISGTLKSGIKIKMNDVRSSRPGANGRSVMDFSGLFAQIDLPKSINANIKILTPDSTIDDSTAMPLTIGNELFDKNFRVYTNNDLIAKKILTDNVINKLTNIRETYGMPFDVVIKDNKMSVRVEDDAMLNKFEILQKHSKENLFIDYSILNYIILVINEMYSLINGAKF